MLSYTNSFSISEDIPEEDVLKKFTEGHKDASVIESVGGFFCAVSGDGISESCTYRRDRHDVLLETYCGHPPFPKLKNTASGRVLPFIHRKYGIANPLEPEYTSSSETLASLKATISEGIPCVLFFAAENGELLFDPGKVTDAAAGAARVMAVMRNSISSVFHRFSDGKIDLSNGAAVVMLPEDRLKLYIPNPDAPFDRKIIGAILKYAKKDNSDMLRFKDGLLAYAATSSISERKSAEMKLEEMKREHEEYITLADSEIALLREKEESLISENTSLRCKNEVLSRKGAPEGEALLLYGSEHDFYDSEIRESVLEAVNTRLKTLPDGRRKDILQDVLAKNRYCGAIEKAKAAFKEEMLANADTMAKVDRILVKNGFSSVAAKKHKKYVWHDDPRYSATVPVSPSDYRAFTNLVQEIASMMF